VGRLGFRKAFLVRGIYMQLSLFGWFAGYAHRWHGGERKAMKITSLLFIVILG
jgi:hypothetical protein